MRTLIKFTLLTLFCCTAHAGQWVPGEGRAPLGNKYNEEQAKELALLRARLEAMRIAGVEISSQEMRHTSESTTKDRQEYKDDWVQVVRQQTSGRILDEKPPIYTLEIYSTPSGVEHGYKCTLEALVEADTSKPDPSFKVSLNQYMEKTEYKEGEPLEVTIKVTQPCWVTLFCKYGNDHVRVLYPNYLWPDHRLNPAQPLRLPPLDNAIGAYLPLYLEPNQTEATEILLAVATKDSIPFDKNTKRETLVTFDEALTRINSWLFNIPRDKRTDDSWQYRIVKK